MSRRNRSAGPSATARSTMVPSGLISGMSSIFAMATSVAGEAEARIKIAYERYAATNPLVIRPRDRYLSHGKPPPGVARATRTVPTPLAASSLRMLPQPSGSPRAHALPARADGPLDTDRRRTAMRRRAVATVVATAALALGHPAAAAAREGHASCEAAGDVAAGLAQQLGSEFGQTAASFARSGRRMTSWHRSSRALRTTRVRATDEQHRRSRRPLA
jgi:hypothetical protein